MKLIIVIPPVIFDAIIMTENYTQKKKEPSGSFILHIFQSLQMQTVYHDQ